MVNQGWFAACVRAQGNDVIRVDYEAPRVAGQYAWGYHPGV